MTKARELAELGTTLSVDGSGNADLAGSLATNGLTVNGAVALQSTTTGGHVVSGVTVDLAAEIKGVTGYGNLRVLFDPSTKDSYILGAYNGGDIHLSRRNASVNYKSLSIDASTGDISFYEDTGTTAKLFWDASAEALGIGTSSPTNVKLQLNGSLSGTAGTGHLAFGEASTPLWNWRLDTTTADLILDRSYGGWQSTPVIAFDRSSGSVGIGTSSPKAQLHISGADNATSLKISGTNQSSGMLSLGDGNSAANNVGVYRGAAASVSNGNYLNLGGYSGVVLTTGAANLGSQAERLRIDASGNVGIGTSSPATKLEVNSGSANEVAQFISTDGTAYLSIKDSGTTSDLNGIGTIGDTLVMWGGGSERMRIDSAGNLLVGTTSPATATIPGVVISPTNAIFATRTSEAPLWLNRLSTDGPIAQFRKDGTTVGSIGSYLGAYPYIISSTNKGLVFGTADVNPCGAGGVASDAEITLGSSTRRFKNLYLSGGVYLGGTGAANLLDDYETGTWTPVFNTGTWSYGSRFGEYVKIGDLVTVWASIVWSGRSGTGGLEVGNLPFLPFAGRTAARAGGSLGTQTSIDTAGGKQIVLALDGNLDKIFFRFLGDNAYWAAVQLQDCNSTGEIQFTFTYRA